MRKRWNLSIAALVVSAAPGIAWAQVAPREVPSEPSEASAPVETTAPPGAAMPEPATTEPATTPPATGAPKKPKRKVFGNSPDDVGERALTWDLNIEGAYGRAFGDLQKPAGFGRIRGGVLRIREPFFYALGATYEISPFTPATFGIQGEAMHLSTGVWLQAGAMIDIQPKPGVMASFGWSLFGAEIQYRSYDKYNLNGTVAVYAKLRIPISIISWATRSHDGD